MVVIVKVVFVVREPDRGFDVEGAEEGRVEGVGGGDGMPPI